MVSTLSILFMIISALICIVLPFVLAAIFKKKGLSTWGVFFIGMLGFFITQVVIRIPLLQIIGQMPWYFKLSGSIVLVSLFLGLTAGLFETAGRLMVFKWFLKKKRSYGDGLMAGLGHGGIEALIITGISVVTSIVYSIMINAGMSEVLFSGLPEAARTQVINALVGTPSGMFLVSGFERVLAIILHIALSLLVLEGIKRGQMWRYSLVAWLFHALVDTTAAYMANLGIHTLIIEGVITILIAVCLWYIFAAKKRFASIPEPEPVES